MDVKNIHLSRPMLKQYERLQKKAECQNAK